MRRRERRERGDMRRRRERGWRERERGRLGTFNRRTEHLVP